jgi:CheY-like chemotaxis protein
MAAANPSGRILIVDDDPAFLDTYREILGGEGYVVEGANDIAAALAELKEPGWDLVLLDRKFSGAYGPDAGLDAIEAIRLAAPTVRVILVTAYADAPSVERAFAAGVHDYLEKNDFLEAMLKAKVRHALEAGRERRMAALANGDRDAALRDLWRQCLSEKDPHRKGAVLEDLVALLFKSIPGFERTETNRSSIDEEIDVTIPNESPDEFWRKAGQYVVAECKNWTKPVGPDELDRFRNKIKRRFGCCNLGFFIGIGGFTEGFESTRAAAREGDVLIVPLKAADVTDLVNATDRNSTLKALHGRALFPRKGP